MRQTNISRRNFYIPIAVLSVLIFLALTVFVWHEQVSANVFEQINTIAGEKFSLMFGKQTEKKDDDSAESLTVKERVVFSANGKIAFASNRDGNSEIYVMNADGSDPVRLTNDAAEDYAPVWSPDGTRIAFVSRRDGNDEIYMMNADGSSQTRLTTDALEDIDPAFSPDGTRLAFASRRDGDFELFTYDLTTFVTTQLTLNTFSDNRPSWSPDSLQIAFTSNRDGDSEIFTMLATAGGAATQRTSNTIVDLEPSWSPDGGRLVYSNNLNGNFEIYSYNIFTAALTRLTNNSIADGQPVWSPDGAKIIFQTNRDINNEIYSMNADGTVPVRLTSNSFDEAYPTMQPIPTLRINDVTTSEPANGTATATFTVSLSVKYPQPVSVIYTTVDDSAAAPGDYLSDNNILVFNPNETSKTISITVNSDTDQENFESFFVDLSSVTNAVIADAQGRGTIRPPIYNGRIAFASNRDGNYEIYTANPDGSDPVRLTNNTTTDTNPAWSPDGTRLAFQSSRDGNVEVYVMNANGTNQTRLTNNISTDGSPAWSPDGTRLAFASNRESAYKIFLVNADGTNLVRLTDNVAADDLPAWSPDGTKLIFSTLRHGSTYEIYSMNADGTNQFRLTNNTTNDLEPQWSLDGSKIVFSTLRDGNSEIYSMNPDGTSPLRLTNNTTGDFSPWWSPDGSRITFVAARDGNNEIYTMSANGTNPQRLTTNTFVDEQPSWQSDPVPRPDLRPTAVTVPPNVTTDLAFNVEWSDLNEGVAPINGSWTDKIYFSTDNQLGSGDVLLAEKPVSAVLAPNQSVNLTQSVTIPWSAITADGNYFIFIQTDANSEQPELDETDNSISLPVGVQRSLRPDLTIDQITAPDSVSAGQTVRVEWRVKNVGNAATSITNWTDWLYLSSDDVPDTTDPVRIPISHSGTLAVDATYTGSVDVSIPTTITAGNYKFSVYTDFDGSDNRNGIFNVVEGIESNNYNIARAVIVSPQGTLTFSGSNYGAIPDGLSSGGYGTARDIIFNVSGLTGNVSSVGVNFTGTHTWIGDIEATIIAPNGSTQHKLFALTGGTATSLCTSDNSDMGGPYDFIDTASGINWWTAATNAGTTNPVVAGTYRTVPSGGAGIPNPPAPTVMNTVFAGLSPAQANGNWILRFRDACAADTGTITNASLTLGVSCISIEQGLVSWWAGDNNTFDYQGNNLGTLGGNANFAAGKVQAAFNFDGDDDFVSIADNDTLDVQTGDFSIDGWVNLRSSREHFIGGKDNCNINSYALTVGADNKPRFRVHGSDGSFEVVAANAVTLNAWHHLAAVKEGTNIKIYVNGILAGTEAVTGTFAANDQNFRIGGRAADGESCSLVSTDGLIDELDVFDRALTLAEVQTIFGADSGGKCRPALLLSIDPNPVIGGRTATGTFTLANPAPTGGAVITLTSGDTNIATVPASITIAENQTSGTFTVTTPTRSADASVSITGDYNGLSKTTTLVVSRSVPDLRVTAAAAPTEVNTANAFDVSWTDLNAGVVTTSSNWTDEVFFSTNNVLDGSDRSLGRFTFTGPLTPDQSGSLTGSVTIPPSSITADGDYFLIIRADTFGNVNEGSFETNNTFVKPIRVLRRAPDLQVSSVTAPAEINTTESFSVSWTDRNFGNAPAAPSWNDQVYFSIDNQVGSDTLIGSLNFSGTLAPDGTIDRTIASLTIPPSAIQATGDYFIYVRTDSGSIIDEGGGTNENNNVTFRPVRINLVAPDLQVSNINTPEEVGTTASFNLTWTDKNFGNARANASWTDYVYFSNNNSVGSDIFLGSINVNTPLDPDQTVDSTISVTIPTSAITADGDYFIYVQTDRNNNVNEGPFENNNVTFKAIRVLLRSPDLQVTAVNAAPEVETEQEFEVAWTVANTGVVRANPIWTDCVYFSQDNQPGSDTNIGCFDFSQGLDPNQTAQRIQNVRVPLGSITQTGNYFFYVQTDVGNTVDEGTAGNNNNRSQFRPLRVRRTLRPDLTVPSVVAPNQAFFDQGIQVQWTVTNNGPGATSGEWSDQIYLSTDQTISNDDQSLGSRQNVSYLNAGESYIVSADVNIPRGVFGNLFIIVRTDGGNSVGEDNDTNNTRAKAINIQVPPLPDLQVPFVQAPEEAFAGQPMLVNWRVENRGTGNMSPQQNNWVDRIYLSQDTTFNPAVDRLLGTRTNAAPLAQNAGYTVNGFSVNLPLNIIGDWYVFVVTDDGNQIYEFNAENNNFNYDNQQPGSPVMIRATPPDLAIPNALTAPATANAGTSVAVSFTVRNQGAFDATPNWYDKIYLSTDQTLNTATDTALATIYRPAPLGAGLQYTVNTTVNIPACLSGTYYLFALTDSGNQIFEFDMKVNAEANNSSQPKQIQITNTPPDLRVMTVVNPANGTAGQPIQIDWTVANIGTGATLTGDWYDRVLLSASPTLGNGTQVSLGSFLRTGAPLAPNADYTRSAVISLPASLQGAWYVFVVADQNGGVQECSGENNNSTAGTTVLNVANPTLNNQPDLRVTTITPSTTSARPGDTIQIQWTGANNGTQDIPPSSSWNDSVYYSTDATLSDNDTLLGTALIAQPLAVGATYQAQTTVTLPNTLPGNYYLIVAVDSDRHVFEGNYESNNTGATAGTFTVIPPEVDLQVTNINVPSNSFAGQTMNVSFTVTNTSPAATTATNWTDYVVLSRDLIIDSTDRTLGYFSHNGVLASGANYSVTGDVFVPAGLTGEYNVFVVTDRSNNVLESNETNNVSLPDAVILELAPPADLVVETITPLASVIPGESATFSWTGRNAGSNAATGLWTDSVYLSSDQTWDIDDVLIGQQTQSGPLNPAATYNATLSTVVPAMNPGAYYVIVRTDTRNRVRESNETNNTRVAATTTAADVIELQLGVPRTTTLTTGQERFYKVAVPANETLLTTLDGESGANNELYTKFGSMVSRSQYDFFYSRPYEADQETVVPETQAGTYYHLARADFVPSGFAEKEAEKGKSIEKPESNNAVENVTIKTETLSFGARSISPNRGGNSGQVTVRINGAKFDYFTQVELIKGTVKIRPSAFEIVSRNEIVATFDLKNAPLGVYDLKILSEQKIADINQDTGELFERTITYGEKVNANAFTVISGGASQNARLLLPSSVRSNTRFSFTLAVENLGNIDIPAPIVRVFSSNQTPLTADPSIINAGYEETIVALGNIKKEILAPEEKVFIPIYASAIRTPQAKFTLQQIDDSNAVIDWNAFENLYRDNSDLSEWQQTWTNFKTLVGNTQGSFNRALRSVAKDKAIVTNEQFYTANDLIKDLLARAKTGQTILNTLNSKSRLPEIGKKLAITGGFPLNQSLIPSNSYCSTALPSPIVSRIESDLRSALNLSPYSLNALYIAFGSQVGDIWTAYLDSTPPPPPAAVRSYSDGDAVVEGSFGVFGTGFRKASVTQNHLAEITEDIKRSAKTLYSQTPAESIPNDQTVQLDTLVPEDRFERGTLKNKLNFNNPFDIPGNIAGGVGDAPNQDPPDDRKFSGTVRIRKRTNKCNQFSGIYIEPEVKYTIDDTVDFCPGGLGSFFEKPLTIPLSLLEGNSRAGDVGIHVEFTEKPKAFFISAAQLNKPNDPPCEEDPPPPDEPGDEYDVPVLRPSDPNDKVGPAGYGAQKFVALNQPLDYRVNFENMPTATAHAQRIRITDQLPTTLDARTLRLKEIGFGNYRFSVPDNRAFYQNRAQLGADLNNLLVEISAGLDVSNGRVTWTLTAIDPATGEQPTNPNVGLLPPNDANNNGQGYVLFTVRPKQNGTTGTALTNNATIIFDTEPPIITNTVSNTLDADLPTSQITALPTSSGTPTFNLSWAGSDPANGSGLASYDVWVAENDQAYTLFKSATTETSAEFVGRYGITYSFYSTARDNAGNVEAAPENPDAVTTVVGGAYEADVAPRPNGNNDGTVNDDDVSLIRRFVAGLDGNFIYNEAQRADSAPLATRGNEILSVADVMQARRFALGLDSVIFTDGLSMSNFAAKFAGRTMTGANYEIRPYRISHIANKLRIGINLESSGGATGTGFTLTFDPAVLSNPSVSPGSDGADTTLTINNSEANQGKLGILIDKSPNQPFAAGSRQLVTVEFDVIPNFPNGTNIGFVSSPVVNEVVNGNADALSSVFSPVIIPLAPTASNAMLGGRVTKADGNGIDKARITLTSSNGTTKRAITNSSGYYRFEDLPAGQSYIISIQHKTFRFDPPTVVVTLNESRENLDFVALE